MFRSISFFCVFMLMLKMFTQLHENVRIYFFRFHCQVNFSALVLTGLTGIWHVCVVALKFTLATYQLIAKQETNANFLPIFRIRDY